MVRDFENVRELNTLNASFKKMKYIQLLITNYRGVFNSFMTEVPII